MTDTKKFRSSDRFEILNARVMWVGQPREVNKETQLCSIKVVSQPGNEKDKDCWVTITGANKLGEFLYSLEPGDIVHAAGKPFFSAYIDKEGNPVPVLELRYPEFVLRGRGGVERVEGTAAEDNDGEEENNEVVEETPAPAKRKPGRPRKTLPFENNE